jgi:hypothetical protein
VFWLVVIVDVVRIVVVKLELVQYSYHMIRLSDCHIAHAQVFSLFLFNNLLRRKETLSVMFQ